MNTIILLSIVSFLLLINIFWMLIIEIRLKRMFRGTKIRNLEEMIVDISKKMVEIKQTEEKINNHLKIVDNRLDKSIRNVETIRFNPFAESGNNQSFAISFLNDNGDGVVMSSLYARDRMSIFAKPINNGKSDFELSVEEKEVLKKSLEN